MIYIFDIPYIEHTFCCNGWIYYRLYIKLCCLLTSFTVQVLHYVALETSNKNILYLSTIGFKAQSLWGHVQIKFNEMQVFERRETRVAREKPLRAENTTKKLNPHVMPSLEIKPSSAHIGGRYVTTALWLNEKKQWLELKLKMFVHM